MNASLIFTLPATGIRRHFPHIRFASEVPCRRSDLLRHPSCLDSERRDASVSKVEFWVSIVVYQKIF